MQATTSSSFSAYQPDLTVRELIAMVRDLLAEQRKAEGLICRYLADLSDRIQERRSTHSELDPYGEAITEIYAAAQAFFGMSIRQARERVRVGRALRILPRIETALFEGTLSYSRVREIARVATPDTELEWMGLARDLPVAMLERRVADASEAQRKPSGSSILGPPSTQPRKTSTLELRLVLRPDQWALIHRAIDGVKRARGPHLGDAEALACVARDALAYRASNAQLESFDGDGVTQTGSLVGPVDDFIGPECIQVLTTMAKAREWHVDSLVEASGLRAEQVARAVTLLEIQGKVTHDFGTYHVNVS